LTREKIQPRLLRVREAAQYLSLSPEAIRRLVLLGKLSYIKIGRNNSPWLIDKTELDKYIEQNKISLADVG